ncbi:protein trapped in endoderm-1-like [Neocloeon triangulifer]|uniref:protein trapped in endoderm-1-like n=1 Tax=Neocloeon triangulifer TaxID=2078957 RepID=UPI00286F333A|nr:protein trapped in endoderm-1-like [Neocloeon triangulifer]
MEAGDSLVANQSASSTDADFPGENLFKGYSPVLLDLAVACCVLFILLGIPGNLITIIALLRCKKVRNATAVFIINLSVSDLMLCCFNLPLVASLFWQRAWRHGQFLCVLLPLLRYGLVAVSLFTVFAITLNRYVMIGHPQLYPRLYKRKYLALMVACTWLTGFGALIPTLLGEWGKFGLDTSIGSCTILPDEQNRSPKKFLFIIGFLIPCLAIVVCYARIFYIVRKTALKSRARNLKSATATPAASNHGGGDNGLLGVATNGANSEISGVTCSSMRRDGLASEDSAIGLSSLAETNGHSDMKSDVGDANGKSRKCSFLTPTPMRLQLPGKAMFRMEDQSTSGVDTGNLGDDEGGVITPDRSATPSVSAPGSPTLQRRERMSSAVTVNSALSHFASVFRKSPRRRRPSTPSAPQPGKMTAKDKKLLKMILVIFVCFLVCYLPITLTKTFKAVEFMNLNILSYILVYLTTCTNPIIYVVMSSEYRQAYKNLIMCRRAEWTIGDPAGGHNGPNGGPSRSVSQRA